MHTYKSIMPLNSNNGTAFPNLQDSRWTHWSRPMMAPIDINIGSVMRWKIVKFESNRLILSSATVLAALIPRPDVDRPTEIQVNSFKN